MSAGRILLIEDDPSISMGLKLNLQAEGYGVTLAEDGEQGLHLATTDSWDLVMLDVMLPRKNGFQVIKELRTNSIDVPVIMLTAKGSEEDKVMGLELGADDYITKPFGVAEVIARVRAALRRRVKETGGESSASCRFGRIVVQFGSREVLRDGAAVLLTATEFDVLKSLIEAHGEALAREEIFTRVWGPSHHGTTRTIDNFVAQLRGKLEADVSNPEHLLTVRGVGYRLAGIE